MPHLDTRLCMLLCVIPLVGDLIEEEEERKPVDEKDNGPTDYWKESLRQRKQTPTHRTLQKISTRTKITVLVLI